MQQPAAKPFVIGGLFVAVLAISGRMLFEALQPVYPKPVRVYFPPRPGVSVEEAKAKLRNLGKYLALYRKTRKVLPPKQRHNYNDAGLPASLDFMIAPGHPWSLPHGVEDLHLLTLPYMPNGRPSVRDVVQIEQICHRDHLGDEVPSWSIRGEERPIFLIQRIVDDDTYRKGKYPVAVLRLNGKVDIVPYDGRRSLELLYK